MRSVQIPVPDVLGDVEGCQVYDDGDEDSVVEVSDKDLVSQEPGYCSESGSQPIELIKGPRGK